MAHRHLKKTVADLLRASDMENSMTALCRLPAKQVVNPLFGLLYSGDAIIRWRTVSAMGAVVSQLADASMESARIIMRRFMWNLNDESGGMGWGSPEAMGEIMARHPGLAREYAAILVSYANPQGNFLEHPGLQQGVMWALGRLARVQRPLVQLAIPYLPFFLGSPEPVLRGLALWAAAGLDADSLRTHMEPWIDDPASLSIYIDGRLEARTVGRLARDALKVSTH